MADITIPELASATATSNDDLFETAIVDAQSASGYASRKHSMAALANHIATLAQYPGLSTTQKELASAINELYSAMNTITYTTLTPESPFTVQSGRKCCALKCGKFVQLIVSVEGLTAAAYNLAIKLPSAFIPPVSLYGTSIGKLIDGTNLANYAVTSDGNVYIYPLGSMTGGTFSIMYFVGYQVPS